MRPVAPQARPKEILRESFVIVTGAMGSGKTTLLRHLRADGFPVVPEPAREILAEQRGIGGNGVPERDSRLFVELMLSRMLHACSRHEGATDAVLFDRGIPDLLVYASHFGFDYPPGENAARLYRFHPTVFFAPDWEAIYATDAERKMSFSQAKAFGDALQAVYTRLGYTLVEIPRVPVAERAAFMRNALSDAGLGLSAHSDGRS